MNDYTSEVREKIDAVLEPLGVISSRFVKIGDFFDIDSLPAARSVYASLRAVGLDGYFRLMEQLIFPAILKNQPPMQVRALIIQLVSDHASCMKMVNELLPLVGPGTEAKVADTVSLAKIRLILKSLGRLIGSVIANEQRVIIPLIETDTMIRFMIGRNYLQFKSMWGQKTTS